MTLQDSVSIIRQIERYYPSFRPDEETAKAWASELFNRYQNHDTKWVWQRINAAIVAEGGMFVPSLPWLVSKVGLAVADVNRELLRDKEKLALAYEREESAQTPEEVKTKNLARVRELLKAAKPPDEKPPDIYTRAVGKSCDNYEDD